MAMLWLSHNTAINRDKKRPNFLIILDEASNDLESNSIAASCTRTLFG